MTATLARPVTDDDAEPRTGTTSSRARALLSMMAWLYLTVFACLATWIGVTVLVFGWSPNLTTSGSMAPSVRPGDVVLTSPIGAEPLGVGSVIVFEGPDGNITHRVTAEEKGTYRTRGDANADEDPRPVHPDEIVGAGRLLIPMIGLPAYWFSSGNAVGFAGWLSLTIVALFLAPNPHRRRRREQ